MPLVTHSINVAEVYAGIRPVEESITDNLLGTLTCFDLTRELGQESWSSRDAGSAEPTLWTT